MQIMQQLQKQMMVLLDVSKAHTKLKAINPW